MRNITKIIVHHAGVYQEDMSKVISSFDRTHRERLHPNSNGYGLHIAYHYIIGVNGQIQKTRPLKEVGYHASDRKVNQESIGICLVGNFDLTKPTDAQYKALKSLIKVIQTGYNNNLTLHGHNEFSSKSCPGSNFDFSQIILNKFGGYYYNMLAKLTSYFRNKIDDPVIRDLLHKIAERIRWN